MEFPHNFSHYEFVRYLEKGSGISCLIIAHDTRSNSDVVCKIFNRFVEYFEVVEREIRIHSMLKHERIVPVLDIVYLEKVIVMVIPYYKNGDLFNYLQDMSVALKEIFRIVTQVVEGIIYLHSLGIAHLDIKPENLFITDDKDIVIGDFGCCESPSSRKRPYYGRGTITYCAPEIFLGGYTDNRAADIWSVGILAYWLITKRVPWYESSDEDIIEQVVSGHMDMIDTMPVKVRNIVQKCCKYNPKERGLAKELLAFVKSQTQSVKYVCSMKKALSPFDVKIMFNVPIRKAVSHRTVDV